MLGVAACGSWGDSALVTALPDPPPVRPTTPSPQVAQHPVRGAEHLKLVNAYGGVYENLRIQALLDDMVRRLAAVSGSSNRPLRVTILNSPSINAFALPSGEIYVTRGLLALADDESELAAVIAHEIAHLTADHAALRQRQAQAAALARRVSEVVEDPDIKADTAATAEVSPALFSQAQELEADNMGVHTLAAAGFDPFAAARFLESMNRYAALPALNAASQTRPGFLSTHPSTPQRIERAKQVARQYAAPGVGRTARSPYLRALDGILYGDDPREGYVRGREFAHVELGIAFTVPQGYVLKNTSSAVLATDGEHTAIRFDTVSVPSNMQLADYLRSGWVKGLIDDSIRIEAVNGLETAIASALVEGWSFRIAVVRGPERAYRFIFASSRPAATFEDAFRRTVGSFRILTPSQRAGMRPLRLRVVPVRDGETTSSLAQRMRGVDDNLRIALFETLNGLVPGDNLAPGDLAKLVTE